MTYDFIVFGGTGLQGRICARDLLESGYSVLLVGRDPSGIQHILNNKRAVFLPADLRYENAIVDSIKYSRASMVINCAELMFNIPIMRACLQTKKSVTDLGGLQAITREQFKLDPLFRKAGILNLTGCGSTPGIVNVMAAYAAEKLDNINTILLGFAWDSNIKKFIVPYSLQSIFQELTQSPITFHGGKFTEENRLHCKGVMNFQGIGKQTVYCIVHSEVYSFARYFKHKGIKNVHYMAGFPEHSLLVLQLLIDLGFGSNELIRVEGIEILPSEFAMRVLKRLKAPKGYRETENLWVNVTGKKASKNISMNMNCMVTTQKGWESAGSNIDTGRTISILSQMIHKKLIKEKGVHAPEGVVPQEAFFHELGKRKMFVYENGKKIN